MSDKVNDKAAFDQDFAGSPHHPSAARVPVTSSPHQPRVWADWVWVNGRLVRSAEAAVSVFDRSFLLGDGLFETMRVESGRMFRLERHLARLERGAAVLRLAQPPPASELIGGLHQLMEANDLQEGVLRITLSRGVGPPGPGLEGIGPPACVMIARPFHGYPGRWYDPGASAVISSTVICEGSPLAGLKTTSYLEHVLARAEAAERGADEALLLNTRGCLAEGSSTNLFLITAGQLLTPDLASGCLAGVTREAVLDLAREADLAVQERALRAEALADAAEAFLTNSLLGIAPLVRVAGQQIADGRPGPITRRLAAGYKALVARAAS